MKKNNKRVYDKDWNFSDFSMNEYIHSIHSYPAMMMPLIARQLIQEYSNENSVVLDPYMGSGTTILEGIVENVQEVIGFDLNPLAVLITQVKSTKFNLNELEKEINNFKSNLSNVFNYTEPTFNILKSWFKEEQIKDLSKLKKLIFDMTDYKNQLFFKLIFSETVREVSLTRNGEFKLYRIPKDKRESFNPDTISIFSSKLYNAFNQLKSFYSETNFQESKTKISIHNIALTDYNLDLESVDLVVTSPPYGDSGTTVAYGQFSRLANEWLDNSEPIKVDKKLMGGTPFKEDILFDITELDTAIREIRSIDSASKNKRVPSVMSFYKDYEESIQRVAKVVKHGGIVVYVVGNRRVRDIELPTDIITARMFEKYGFTHEKTIVRDIINKRMPSKTSPSNGKGQKVSTMMHEYIVILKKK